MKQWHVTNAMSIRIYSKFASYISHILNVASNFMNKRKRIKTQKRELFFFYTYTYKKRIHRYIDIYYILSCVFVIFLPRHQRDTQIEISCNIESTNILRIYLNHSYIHTQIWIQKTRYNKKQNKKTLDIKSSITNLSLSLFINKNI